MENLFDSPTTLRDPNHLVGRRGELKRIFSLMKTKQSVSLIGPRRIGKTSLLTCLRDQTLQQECGFDNSDYLFIYLDLQRFSMKKETTFLDALGQTLKEQTRHLGIQVEETYTRYDLLDALLFEYQRLKRYPVLMMDAFDEIANCSSIGELGFLRAVGGAGMISYVTASMDGLPEIVRRLPDHSGASSPFYNIFAHIRLQPFTQEEAQKLLFDTSHRGGSRFEQEEVDWIINQAGYHPYLLQQVAAQLFEAKHSPGSNGISYKTIQEEVLQNLSSHFEDSWVMLSAADQQRLLKERTSTLASTSADLQIPVPDSLPSMTGAKAQSDKQSAICPEFQHSELFSLYLRETGKLIATSPVPINSPLNIIFAKEDDLTKEDGSAKAYTLAKKLLANLHNTNMLGQSEFIRVAFIAKRIEQQQATTPTLRGKIVQDTLREAHRKTAGAETQSDRDRGWLHYNILYYCYFMVGHSMSQRDIARRLGFSERQYYRFFAEALERLKHALEEMDAAAVLEQNG